MAPMLADRLAVLFGWGCAYFVYSRHDENQCALCRYPWAAHVPFWARRMWRSREL